MDKHKKGWQDFIKFCKSIPDEKTIASTFDLFFTAEERDDLAMRYLIIQALLAGKKTQRDIAKDLNVSIAKITRGSNELKRTQPMIIEFLKKNLLWNI